MLGPTTAGARPTAASCFGHAVGRAAHARRATVQDMGVNLRGGHVPVPEQLLDSPDVVVLLEKMCREGVAQRVGCAALGDAGLSDRRLHHSLQHGLVQVVPPALARLPMEVDARRGKDPLPRPLPARVRILPYERRRQLDPAGAVLQVILMLLADALEMPRQRPFHRHGSIVTRSLSPLPPRTTIWLVAKSTSWTRSRQHSSTRNPAP